MVTGYVIVWTSFRTGAGGAPDPDFPQAFPVTWGGHVLGTVGRYLNIY